MLGAWWAGGCRDGDPTGLSEPLPSGGIYEDSGNAVQQQQQAILAQQQQLMNKLDVLVTLMQRDIASRAGAAQL